MSALNSVSVTDRFGRFGTSLATDLTMFEAALSEDDDGQHRACFVVSTGCAMAHVRMTQAECERLITLMQSAVKSFPAMAEAA